MLWGLRAPKKGKLMSKFKYKVKEEGTDKEEIMEAMSLHKLIKKLDPKKTFRVEYENKKSNDCTKIVFNGTYKIV